MKRWAIGVLAAVFLESGAMACSCFLGATNDETKRQFAREIAREAFAVVEAIQIEDMDLTARQAARYRVTKVHFGDPPRTFRSDRQFDVSEGGLVSYEMTTCDSEPGPDKPRLTVLRKPANASARAADDPAFALSDMCEYLFLTQSDGLRLLKEEVRRPRRSADKKSAAHRQAPCLSAARP